MARKRFVVVQTQTPQDLLKKIKLAIDEKTIDTWRYDSDGDFTHTRPQFEGKAWLCPTVTTGKLQLEFKWASDNEDRKDDFKGIFIGRFIEMLVNHFSEEFTQASAA